MECNKDKATRAKEVAESMFTAGDIFGALRLALEARNLFPALEGIIQMIVTFNVYISAMNKVNGETDWNGVLRVDPLADDDTLRKQYRKLALMLHPDKNKSTGADGAFDLVSQAWGMLSDKAKRVAYNEKINAVACTFSTECVDSPEQTRANVNYNFTKSVTSTAKIQKTTAVENASKTAQTSQSNTFWTICHQCKLRYQYSRAYVNRRLVCHICREPYFAVEIDRPVQGTYRFVAPRRSLQNRQTTIQKVLGKSNFHWGPLPRISGASSTAQAANVSQQAYEKAKRKRKEEHKWEEAFPGDVHVAQRGYFSPAKVSKALEDLSLSSHGESRENPLGAWNRMVEVSNICKSKQGDFECCDLSGAHDIIAIGAYQAELQNRRMELDIEEISRKLEELKPVTDDIQRVNEAEEEYISSADTCDQVNIGKSEGGTSGSQATKSFTGTTMADAVAENLGKMSIDVPDNSVKKAAIEDKKEANVEELINDMGKLGEEKKGNEKVSREYKKKKYGRGEMAEHMWKLVAASVCSMLNTFNFRTILFAS